MALQRMRETVCMPNNLYQDITHDEKYKALSESVNKKIAGLKLTESLVDEAGVLSKMREAKCEESLVQLVATALREKGVNLKEHRLYRVPVAKINPPGTLNGNRRRYPESLWRNVMENQQDKWKGLCGLADHPTDDCDPGSIKNSSIVWLGMEIDPTTNLVFGIGSFVGPYGHMFQEIIDAGGRVGFSSSGFGELMSDGETVNPDTYQIERLADVVLNPSQEVYGAINDEQVGLGNIEYSKQNAVHESKSEIVKNINNTKLTESKDNKTMENMEESKKNSAFLKAEEKALRTHINTFLNENTGIVNPLDRLTDLNEILTIIHEGKLTDLEEGVTQKLEEMKLQLEKDIDDATKMKEALGSNDISKITEDAQKLVEKGNLLAEQCVDYKKYCEGLTKLNQALDKKVKALELKQSLAEKKNEKTSLAKNKEVVSANAAFEALKEQYKDEITEMKNTVASLKESNQKLSKSNAEFERKNGVLTRKLDEANKVLQNNAKLREGKVTISKEDAELFETLKEENATLTAMVERLQARNNELKGLKEKAENETKAAVEMYNEATTPDIHVQPKFTERASKYFNWRENEGLDIEEFWASKAAQYGESIAPYEHQIRDAKTLREAKTAFYNVIGFIDADAKAARESTFREGGADKAKRMEILEESGMKIDDDNDVERANANARAMRAKFGLI